MKQINHPQSFFIGGKVKIDDREKRFFPIQIIGFTDNPNMLSEILPRKVCSDPVLSKYGGWDPRQGNLNFPVIPGVKKVKQVTGSSPSHPV
jgi:hypothetical protein